MDAQIDPAADARAGELSPSARQKLPDANRAPFLGFARSLRDVSLKALDAIDARVAPPLLEIGGDIDQACEACHLVYWHPLGPAPPPG